MRRIIFKNNFLTLLFSLGITLVNAQETAVNTEVDAKFNKGLALFNNKSYAAAHQMFGDVVKTAEEHSNLKGDAEYYQAFSAVKLDLGSAEEKVLAFVEHNPYHIKKERIYLNVGNHYFANRKAAHSLKWYKRVNDKLLGEEEKNELYFKMGYALLASNYLKDAKEYFNKLLGNPNYGNDARYYYGYIAYKQENFGEAEDNLSQLANNATYQAKANYYILDISFKAGRFDKSVEIGEKLLKTSKDQKEISEISKIVGESYFNLKQYENAIPHLQAYKGKKGRWTNTDYYYLGYAYYKLKDYPEAISYFTKIIGGTNKVAQNAYYHLGECYLELDKKGEALNAFKNASEMDFDSTITQSAFLNYAKLSYEQGNPYESIPDVLQKYLEKYPTAAEASEIKELLITSYLAQQDYEGALEYLKKNKSPENDNLANEVSLYRGIQLFNEQKIKQSESFFASASQANTKTVSLKGYYWLAETNYLQGNYDVALTNFLKVTNDEAIAEQQVLDYNLAYTYFKLKNYEKAASHFEKFLSKNIDDTDLNDDASSRLGDAYYATKKYDAAIAAYAKVIEQAGVGSDYAQYQTAMSKGFKGNAEEKIKSLQNLINNYKESALQDDALFQLAATYTTTNQTDLAQKTYDKILTKHAKSSYVPSTLLRQGLLFYNNNKNNQALAKFKEVVAKHPNSKEARQAVTNIKNVYIDLGKVDEYASWVKGVAFINVTDAELDNATYQSAENKFLENDNQRAIIGFNKYLNNFSSGIHILKANFYLGQAYYNTGQLEKSIPNYDYVIQQEKSEFTEESLTKLANIFLKKSDWNSAMKVLKQLETDANYPQNIIFAQSNLMKGYYDKEAYENAIVYAEKVLANDKVDINITEDAKIIIARAAFKTGDLQKAQDFFFEVDQNATGELKAETLYYNAFFLHNSKDYEASNEEVQNLIANYSSYKYWGVKSYIIMAKNYYALKDAYQATYILENIVKNFKDYEDLVEEAKNELLSIKKKEAKTNESINNQN